MSALPKSLFRCEQDSSPTMYSKRRRDAAAAADTDDDMEAAPPVKRQKHATLVKGMKGSLPASSSPLSRLKKKKPKNRVKQEEEVEETVLFVAHSDDAVPAAKPPRSPRVAFNLPTSSVPRIRSLNLTPPDHSPFHAQEAGNMALLHDLQARVLRLQNKLETEHQERHRELMLTRQDAMLDILKARELEDKAVNEMRRLRRHVQSMQEEHTAEKDRWNKNLADEHKRFLEVTKLLDLEEKAVEKAKSEASMWRETAKHAENLTRTLQEDLDELRRIENEDRERRRSDARGLPPAYGSLNDEDYQPPYHERDCGTLELATIKRNVRDTFTQAISYAYTSGNIFRSSTIESERNRADAEMFLILSYALRDVATGLHDCLRQADDIHLAHVHTIEYRAPITCMQSAKKEIRRTFARPSYVAERVAKLLLELTLRLISALEVRPLHVRGLRTRERILLELAYTEIDETLLAALRKSLPTYVDCDIVGTAQRKLWELAHYTTQVCVLQAKLSQFRAGLELPMYFEKSYEWLSENVEMERREVANATIRPSTLPALSAALNATTCEEGSEVSSQAPEHNEDWESKEEDGS